MKKIILIFTAVLTTMFVYSQGSDTWTKKANFGGTGRASGVGFSIGGKGYVGTGETSGITTTKEFWQYDPVADAWSQKADFGGAGRKNAVGFCINGYGYIGLGGYYDGSLHFYKDFWQYDPISNTWVQKADFAGAARTVSTVFVVGNKGYLGTGASGNYPNLVFYKDFWEYDPATDVWTQRADFAGTARGNCSGFSIGSKGYIGTGYDVSGNFKKDFWEYDTTSNSWIQKADFGGTARVGAQGFSINGKGYIGTGNDGSISYKDFWQYDPATNNWTKKADYGGLASSYNSSFCIYNKGYIGLGIENGNYKTDLWEYTPDACPAPSNLRVPKISDSCARLNWSVPDPSVEHIKISYRPVSSSLWKVEQKKGGENAIFICGLTPSTTYEWEVKNICANGATEWVKGPNFTTRSSVAFSSNTEAVNDNNIQGNVSVQITPNPNRGSFTLQMLLPAKASVTTLILYNNFGQKIWQQNAGQLSGSVSRNVGLENKLSAGVYVMMIQHGDTRLMQKVVVTK